MEILRKTKDVNLFYELPMQKESYITEMLQNNVLKTMLPVSLIRTGNDTVLSYKADGLQSFANRFSREEPDWRRVQTLIRGIAACVRELQGYLIPPEGIILSTAFILVEPETGKYRFLYTTVPERSFSEGMKQLFEELMLIFSHSDRDGVISFYELYGKFLDDNFTPAMLLQTVRDWDGRRKEYRAEKETPESWESTARNEMQDIFPDHAAKGRLMDGQDKKYGSGVTDERDKAVNGRLTRWLIITGAVLIAAGIGAYIIFGTKAVKGIALAGVFYVILIIIRMHSVNGEENKGNDRNRKDINYGNPFYEESDTENEEKSYGKKYYEEINYEDKGDTKKKCSAEDYAETDVLRAPGPALTRLVPAENTELMPISLVDRRVCRIGRIPENNEYCIPDPGISRNHARISCEDGAIVIRDMHSTNGTYVNRERISEESTKELHYGDVVSFAGEDFYCV